MRVTLCINALDPEPGGIGRYVWELCKGLAARNDVDLRYFGRHQLIDDPARLVAGERITTGRGLKRLVRWAKANRALSTSLVHAPNYFLPASAPQGIITVHDLSVFRFPETHPAARVRDFERLFASSLERASHVITDTETIRRELIDMFSVPGDHVTTVPLGIDARFGFPYGAQGRSAIEALGLAPGSYGLCVSTLEPRKKVAELIAAWRMLPSPLRGRYPLVLAGGSGWLNEDLHEAIASAASEGWLRTLGFVDEALLAALYAHARLFVYPSIYEGFGLPPLEAMASGVPVLVAGGSCLSEVCGDVARYLDPDDLEGFTSAIEQSLVDDCWRDEAAARGIKRAALFTWDRCVDSTVAVYRQISEKN